jgi:predicted dehydrogenase
VPPLKLAVVGAGVMGRNYLRAAKTAGLEIAAVIDADHEKALAAGVEFGLAALTSGSDDFDAMVVAVPTAAHAAVALPLLRNGVHCLVEKPFAASDAECRALIDAAATSGAVLQVGHVERFNPAVEALLSQKIEPASIQKIAARRMGPASARVTDISVVLDLMVHDLDIILALKPLPVTDVAISGNIDHAEAEVLFADRTTARLIASRTAATRTRDLVVTTSGGTYHLDYIAKNLQGQVYPGDALADQLSDFMMCIREGKAPRVTGAAALRVMQVTWRIEAALRHIS